MVIDAESATPSNPSTPLLGDISVSNKGGGLKWQGLLFLDVKEAKLQTLLSLPLILTNGCYYAISLISVMFAGHLGDLPLAGATLANSWATVSGFAFMIGLSGALETLCGQGYGAKLYGLMGIYLQASCIISFFFSLLISVLWFYTEPILIFLHQQPNVAKTASLYIKYLIPGLFAFGFVNNILRFLQTQSIVLPPIIFSVLPLLLHLGIVYALVYWVDLGFRGAPLGVSISMWISFFMLASYVIVAKKIEHTWKGFSSESFGFIVITLKLALPSAAMVCLEYWAFEILVLFAGLLPNSENTTSLIAMCVNTEAVAYMITYGLSAAASTRVSNELGAGCSDRAKNAMAVTLKLSFVFAIIFVLALVICRNTWAGFFSNSPSIIQSFASLVLLLGISIMLDSVQGVLSGVVRACGWQHLAMFVNLSTFYVIGLPISCLLSFEFKFNARGLWIGLICGLFCQAGSLFVMLLVKGEWRKLQLPPTGVE